MIEILTIGGETVKATAQKAGADVVVLAFVCPTETAADRLLEAIGGRLERRAARPPLAKAVAPAPEVFTPGTPVQVRTWSWDEGEMSIDAVVLGRREDGLITVRTRFGQVRPVHARDLTPKPRPH